MSIRWLIIRARGYLPDDTRWRGFRVDEEFAVFITPDGRRFDPRELMSWSLRFDEYHTLRRMYELDYIPRRSHVVMPLPFRGGRRITEPQCDTVTKEKKKAYRKNQEKAKKKRASRLP